MTCLVAVIFSKYRNTAIWNSQANEVFVSNFCFQGISNDSFVDKRLTANDFTTLPFYLDFEESQIVVDDKDLIIFILPLLLLIILLLSGLYVIVVERIELECKNCSAEGSRELLAVADKLIVLHFNFDLIQRVAWGSIVTSGIVEVVVDSSLHLEINFEVVAVEEFKTTKCFIILLVPLFALQVKEEDIGLSLHEQSNFALLS